MTQSIRPPRTLKGCLDALGALVGRRNEPYSAEALAYAERSDAARLCKDPLVSVFIITYNSGAFIDDGIRGVMEQETDFPFELIVSDDGSTDDTLERCAVWQAKFPERIRILSARRNAGILGNRLRAQIACRAPWVALMDGDDFWINPKKLQHQVERLRETDAVACVALSEIRNERTGKSNRLGWGLDRTDWITPSIFLRHYLHTATYVYSRGALDAALRTHPDLHGLDDVDLIFCLASQGRIALLHEVVSVYRISGVNECATRKGDSFALWVRWQILRLVLFGPRQFRRLALWYLIHDIRTMWATGHGLEPEVRSLLWAIAKKSWYLEPFCWPILREWLALFYSKATNRRVDVRN